MTGSDSTSVMLREFGRYVLDDVRTRAYARALAETVRPGDVVVDIGSGFGLLAFLALQAGASHVYAIEHLPFADLAAGLARDNGFEHRITFVSGRSSDVALRMPANMVVAELFGQFAVEEHLAEHLADARERLAPGGRILPLSCDLWLFAASLPVLRADWNRRYGRQWADVSGLDLRRLRQVVIANDLLPYVVHGWSTDDVTLGPPTLVHSQDFLAGATSHFAVDLTLEIRRDGLLDGLVGYFTSSLSPGVILSTSPTAPANHWQQVVFPVLPSRLVRTGDVIPVHLSHRPSVGWHYVPFSPVAASNQPSTRSGAPSAPEVISRRIGRPARSVSGSPSLPA
jgi:SAM-dependent methyltransferase